ncbi:MAG: TonB-dependent receptor [Bacteroidota bacterium]
MFSFLRYRITYWLFALLGLLGPLDAFAQQPAIVEGRVVSASGEAMAYVNVQLQGTIDGAASNLDGRFSFSTQKTGAQTVRASMIGFEPALAVITLAPGDTVSLDLVLKETLISLEEAVVTASAFSTGDAEAVTLQSLEVVTTPGAAADIFLAIKTFPGVAMVDEGAGLFVRGGDVSETVLLLDQATVAHPYKHETPTGGVFGTIPPFLVGGTFFSSGGFSAKYGNALSGVLSMESLDLPQQASYTANLGLAAASIGADVPLIPGKLGVRVSGNQSFTKMMMEVNGFADEFSLTPRGTDVNLSVIYNYSTTGRLKFFNYTNHDRVGVFVDEPSFDGVFEGNTANWLHNVQWSDIFSDWLVSSSFSVNRYNTHQQLGVLDLKPSDVSAKLRTDLEKEISDDYRIFLGAEYEQVNNNIEGSVPQYTDILDPEAAVSQLDESYRGSRAGTYAEMEFKATRHIAARVGLRADYFGLPNAFTLDPRISLRYAFNKATDFRLAWGLYHQISSAYSFNETTGSPSLMPQRAQHFIAGLNHEQGQLMMRLEGYYKPYDNLVIEHGTQNFTNEGNGDAFGLDAFIKYGGFLQTRANGWISYSYLESTRKQARQVGREVVHQTGPSGFDITHNLTVVGKMRLIGFLSGGVTYRYATGRPITPVIDAVPDESGAFYWPIEGDIGSERLPSFQRLDATVSYYLPFGTGHNATFYLAVSNLLNRTNVLDYEYAPDYSTRTPRRSNYRRFLYFGVSINFNRIVG